MLYLIGLGLGDEKDITVKGLEIVKRADKVFLEMYTSILGVGKERLVSGRARCAPLAALVALTCCMRALRRRSMGRSWRSQTGRWWSRRRTAFWTLPRRATWHSWSWVIRLGARAPGARRGIALGCARHDCSTFASRLCHGSATTHADLMNRAKELGIGVQVVHNASIMNAAGCCGLQLYNFGHTVTIPFFTEEWQPDSFYDRIKFNQQGGMHTLCLLGEPTRARARALAARACTGLNQCAPCCDADIKVKEPDFDAMRMGRKRYLPPRFMSVTVALQQLLQVEERRGEGGAGARMPATAPRQRSR